jgi:hypothetical protein
MKIEDKLFVTRIEPAHIWPQMSQEVDGKNGEVWVPKHLDWDVEFKSLRGNRNRDALDDICVVRVVLCQADGDVLKLGDRIAITLERLP